MIARFYFAMVAANVVSVLFALSWLPDRAAVRFDASGTADEFVDRGLAVLTMAMLGVALGLLFWFLAHRVDARATQPTRLTQVGIPHRRWWLARPERMNEARQRISDDIFYFGSLTMMMLTAVNAVVVSASLRKPPAYGAEWWVLLAVYTGGVLLYTAYVLLWRYRPDPSITQATGDLDLGV